MAPRVIVTDRLASYAAAKPPWLGGLAPQVKPPSINESHESEGRRPFCGNASSTWNTGDLVVSRANAEFALPLLDTRLTR